MGGIGEYQISICTSQLAQFSNLVRPKSCQTKILRLPTLIYAMTEYRLTRAYA